MKSHPFWCWGLLILLVTVSALGAWRLRYKEDITDFLPVDRDYRRSLEIYQDIAGGSGIAVCFTSRDDSVTAAALLPRAMEMYIDVLGRLDTAHWFTGVTARVRQDDILAMMDFCYAHIPWLLRPGELPESPADTSFCGSV
jgi:hypothetical protein